MAAPRASKHVWALDFDGVICDSVGELALAAWKVCMGFINGSCMLCVARYAGFLSHVGSIISVMLILVHYKMDLLINYRRLR